MPTLRQTGFHLGATALSCRWILLDVARKQLYLHPSCQKYWKGHPTSPPCSGFAIICCFARYRKTSAASASVIQVFFLSTPTPQSPSETESSPFLTSNVNKCLKFPSNSLSQCLNHICKYSHSANAFIGNHDTRGKIT